MGQHRRAAWAGLPYGDQALFVRRAVLEAIGGVAQVPIAEDLDLARDLRRHGRLALLRFAVSTSARRYQSNGVLRTWARNAVALAAWRLSRRDRVRALGPRVSAAAAPSEAAGSEAQQRAWARLMGYVRRNRARATRSVAS